MIITLLLAASVVPAGQFFECTPTAVWDGDGPIWCAEGPRIRLSGIAAREMDGTCRPGHPCPAADPVAARDHLVSLLGKRGGVRPSGHISVSGPTMRCRSAGGGGGDRTAAFCASPKSGDAAVRIKVRMARTAADIIDIGKELITVKAALGHGQFLPWIEAEFGMSPSTAERFIQSAERFGDKIVSVTNFTPTVLYALAAPSTADEIADDVVERASNGETFTAADIKAMKAEWNAEKAGPDQGTAGRPYPAVRRIAGSAERCCEGNCYPNWGTIPKAGGPPQKHQSRDC